MGDKTISLDEGKLRLILDEYFALPEKRQRMSPEEIETIANALNEKIDIPLINEKTEARILIKIVLEVDNFFYNNLPNELYDLIRSLPEGIDDDEAKNLIKRLSKLANEKIDFPYLTEQMEYTAIRFIVAIVINAMRNKLNVVLASKKLKNIAIPDGADASDSDLEKLLVAV
jgi:uncharacterized protein YfkK (UPF0435 family)